VSFDGLHWQPGVNISLSQSLGEKENAAVFFGRCLDMHVDCRYRLKIVIHTVGGRNPAPPGIYKTL